MDANTSGQILSLIAELKNDIASLRTELVAMHTQTRALVDVQKKLIHERLKVPEPESRAVPVEPPAMTKVAKKQVQVTVTRLNAKQISVGGRTFDFNALIKASGPAKFEPSNKTWTLPIESLAALEKNFAGAEGAVLLVSDDARTAAFVTDTCEEEIDCKAPVMNSFAFQD